MAREAPSREKIVQNWLPRYTGMPLAEFGRLVLLTNFFAYVQKFAAMFAAPIRGIGGPMQACTSASGITIVNFGIGSPNAATIMDLLSAIHPEAVLFLGKCGGLKTSVDLGHFILPIGAIRGEGTGLDYFPIEIPALPSFRLHALVAEEIVKRDQDYRTGVVYTTNRRVWEHDNEFRASLVRMRAIGIDMETATLFIVGHHNEIPRGALLLVSDVPVIPEGIKTEEMDREVNTKFSSLHLEIGIAAMESLRQSGEKVKHLRF
jgi:AMP nucleosidase